MTHSCGYHDAFIRTNHSYFCKNQVGAALVLYLYIYVNTYTKTHTHHPQIALGLELQKARAQIRILSLLPDGGNDARGHSEESDWPSHVDPLSVGVCIPIRVCLRVCVCVWIYVYMYVSTRDSCIFYICLIWTSHTSLYAHVMCFRQYMSRYA